MTKAKGISGVAKVGVFIEVVIQRLHWLVKRLSSEQFLDSGTGPETEPSSRPGASPGSKPLESFRKNLETGAFAIYTIDSFEEVLFLMFSLHVSIPVLKV